MLIPEIEKQPLSTIKKFQEEQLVKALDYLNQHSPYYKRMFKSEHIEVQKVRTLEDLRYLPLTGKQDLQKYNADFICVPRHQIVDYITTSGTLGDPVTFAMSDKDLDRMDKRSHFLLLCRWPSGEIYLMTQR
jgi:phenylacetate-CoA ligase